MEEELRDLIKKSLEIAEKTGSFVIDEAPELIHQFFIYQTLQSAILMLISFCGIIAPLIFFRKSKDYTKAHREEYFGKGFSWSSGNFLIIISLTAAVIWLPMFIVQLLDLIKIIFAPKLFLIQYFLDSL